MELSKNPTIIMRPHKFFLYSEKRGAPQEVAPLAWEEFHRTSPALAFSDPFSEFLGVALLDESDLERKKVIYQAGVTLEEKPTIVIPGTEVGEVPSGKYARYLMMGPYHEIGEAFGKILTQLESFNVRCRSGGCLENYLNDPRENAPEKLLTELLVPIK